MKKQTILTAILSLFLIIGINNQANAQFGKKLKNAIAKKSSKKGGKKGGKKGKGAGTFAEFNNIQDEYGISGEYTGLKDASSTGFKFVKEDEGKIVNKLYYYEKKGEPLYKFNFKESYYNKKQIKLFFYWKSPKVYYEIIEVAPGVVAIVTSDRTIDAYDKPVALDATRTVVEVGAKNRADFDTWDIETAQAKVDMLISSLNTEKIEKDKKKLMRFEAYKNYKGKIAFAKGTSYLKNSRNLQPTEKVANFITKRELGATVAYKPYFEQPLEVSHPGAWFNVTYEMTGFKTDREELRKKSTKFSKNIPQYDDEQNHFYFMWSKVLLDTSNNRADYAFLELLRQAQDQLKPGQTYDVKVTVWAFKDGENIDPVASGTIQLEYTTGANGTEKLLFDPVKGWITVLENYLDE
ncbi:MAG: hypothetical protein ACWA45_00585 [Flavobacteriales bacterium]